MNLNPVAVWRQKTKERMIQAFGGGCGICGYNRNTRRSMIFHHDGDKDFSISSTRVNPKSWIKIVEELRKCVLLCTNCHGEVHDGITEIPENIKRFDENYVEYERKYGKGFMNKEENRNECPICGNLKSIYLITCSRSCAAKKSRKVDWDKIDVVTLYEKYKNYEEIGRLFGISGGAVKKRCGVVQRQNVSLLNSMSGVRFPPPQ